MSKDELDFKTFLELCQQNGVTVWADYKLLAEKHTTGHWKGADHISVHRPNQKVLGIFPGRSSDYDIATFISESPNIKREIAILLHEYGHRLLKHPHQSTVDSATAHQHEVDAWNKAEEVGQLIGINDFTVFHVEKNMALLSYRKGFGLESSN